MLSIAGLVLMIVYLGFRVLQEAKDNETLRFRLTSAERKLRELGVSIEYGEDWIMTRRKLNRRVED